MQQAKCMYINICISTAYHSGFLSHFILISARNMPHYIPSLIGKLTHVRDQYPNRSKKVHIEC